MNLPLRPDVIDWLQGECLSADCHPRTFAQNGKTLDQHKAYMSAEQIARQKQIESLIRRKMLRAIDYSRQ